MSLGHPCAKWPTYKITHSLCNCVKSIKKTIKKNLVREVNIVNMKTISI